MTVAQPRDPLLDCLSTRISGGDVLLDLRERRWIQPIQLVGAASIAHSASLRGHAFRLLGPTLPEVANYVARMRLGLVLDHLGASHDLPQVRERDLRKELLEVSALDGRDDVRALARLVRNKVRPDNAAAADALWESLVEIGANVQDHAETVGFAAVQTLPRSREVYFAVGDGGPGIARTLAARGATTDRGGILLALSGTSRFPDPDRGRGLPTTLELVSALGGELYIASGLASLRVSNARQRHARVRSPYTGTLLQGRIRIAW